MKTKEHLKKLYEYYKTDGIIKALKYDLGKTLERKIHKDYLEPLGVMTFTGIVGLSLLSGIRSFVYGTSFSSEFQRVDPATIYAMSGVMVAGLVGYILEEEEKELEKSKNYKEFLLERYYKNR